MNAPKSGVKIISFCAVLFLIVIICCFAVAVFADLYSDLGVGRRATQSEIKKQFKKLTREWHPDTTQQPKDIAKNKYAQILRAYGVLSNAEKRRMYDVHGVIEGENGVPSAADRARHGFQNMESAFSFFFGGGNRPGSGGFGGGGARREAGPIEFSSPSLNTELFAKMRLFRGPRMFCVLVYADSDIDSRIFAPAWERLTSPSSFGAGSGAAAFKHIVAFYRINVATDALVMELAGIPPQELPLVILVRNGQVSQLDADAVQINPQDQAGMTNVMAMFVADYANDLIGADTPVLKTKQAAQDFVMLHRFRVVLLLDKSRDSHINAYPCAAAVKSAFADMAVAFLQSGAAVLGDCPGVVGRRAQAVSTAGDDGSDVAWIYRGGVSPRVCDPEHRVPLATVGSTGQEALVRGVAHMLRINPPMQGSSSSKDSAGEALLLRPSAVWPEAKRQAAFAPSRTPIPKHPFRLVTRTTATTLLQEIVVSAAADDDNGGGDAAHGAVVALVQLVSGVFSPEHFPLLNGKNASVADNGAIPPLVLDMDTHPQLLRLLEKGHGFNSKSLLSSRTHVSFLIVAPSRVCLVANMPAAEVGESGVAKKCAAGQLPTLFAREKAKKKSTKTVSRENEDAAAAAAEDDERHEEGEEEEKELNGATWLEEMLHQDSFPPEPFYQPVMRWIWWTLRRAPLGIIAVVVLQLLLVKVVRPVMTRMRGGAAAGADGAAAANGGGRPVPNPADQPTPNTTVFGLRALRDEDLSTTKLFVLAVASDKAPKPPPRLPTADATKKLTAASTNKVETRSLIKCSAGSEHKNAQTLWQALAQQETFQTRAEQSKDGIVFVCCRGGKKCVAGVAPAERDFQMWLEGVMDGAEPLRITF